MAKQDLLGGGYTGKLGQTIGQRWKNIYTMRTYTKPANPQTEAQQANRTAFQKAVEFAQKGQQMNYHSAAFDTAHNTEWAQRMTVAKLNCNQTLPDLANIPIVPQYFASNPTITNIALEEVTPNTSVKFALSGSLPDGGKAYSIMLYFKDGSRKGEYLLLQGATSDDDTTLITCDCSDTTDIGIADVYALIVSRDDVESASVTYSPRLQLESSIKVPFQQTFTVENVDSNDGGGFFVALQMGIYGDDLVGSFTVQSVTATGTFKLKQAVQQAGSEEAAASLDANQLSFTVQQFQADNTTGIITFMVTPSLYARINHYALTEMTFEIAWVDAYTDTTSITSGSATCSETALPTYTQPLLDTTIVSQNIYLSDSGEAGEMYMDAEREFAMIDFPQAVLANLGGSTATLALKGTVTGTAIVDDTNGTRHTGAITGLVGDDDIETFDNTKISSLEINVIIPAFNNIGEWTAVSVTIATMNLELQFVYNGVPFGAFTSDTRWTKAPAVNITGTFIPS